LRCFQQTGRVELFACESNAALLQKITRQYQVAGFPDVAAALKAERFDGVAVCTPANTHISIALQCLRQGAALLIEKPLSTGLEQVEELLGKSNRLNELHRPAGDGQGPSRETHSRQFVAVAYVYHFQPGLKAVREVLRKGSLGRPLQVVAVVGQHFPTFRPAYREIYYTRHETGGGAIQDMMTHLVNAVEWLVGPSTRVYCEAAHQALEGVTVEDTVCAAARNGDVLVNYTLNQFQAPNEGTFLVHCERGSLKVELHEQRWGVWPHGAVGWEYHPAPVKERDDLFVAQANAFLDGMGGGQTDLSTVEEAAQTLKFNLAALESWRTGMPVEIGGGGRVGGVK
jgi:predicted dehydrogenase